MRKPKAKKTAQPRPTMRQMRTLLGRLERAHESLAPFMSIVASDHARLTNEHTGLLVRYHAVRIVALHLEAKLRKLAGALGAVYELDVDVSDTLAAMRAEEPVHSGRALPCSREVPVKVTGHTTGPLEYTVPGAPRSKIALQRAHAARQAAQDAEESRVRAEDDAALTAHDGPDHPGADGRPPFVVRGR